MTDAGRLFSGEDRSVGIHLIGMECKKVLMSRSFQRLWLFLLAVFSFLTLWMEGEGSRSGYRPADYELLYEGLSEYTPAEAVEILEETKTAVKTRMEQTLLLESRLPDTGAFQGGFSGSENTEMRGLPGKQEKLLLADFLPGDDWAAVMLLEDVSREAGAVERRDSLLRETVANADRLLSVALFRSQMEEGTQGNVEKTRADFIKAQPIAVDRVTSEKGMRLLFDDPLGDMFVLILVFYSLSVMVAVGYNNGMELLVLSCRKGGGKSVFYRSMALILLNGVIWLSFFLCRCACSRFLYSWGSLLRPLQSMSDYVKCLFPISVGGMIAIFFFWKWLWFSLLGLLMLGLLKVFQKEIVSLLAVLGLWGAGFALYRGLADNSVFRIWKYENAYLLLRPDLIWGTYNNYQLGSMWVSGWVLAVSFTSGAALVVGLLLFFFRERLLIRDRGRRILAHPKKAHFVGLKSGELYKNYMALPIALAMLLLALLQMCRYQGEAIRLGQESLVYRSYMSRWERSLKERDPELEEEMMEEEQELLRAISGKSEHYEPETAALLIQGLYRAKERYSQSIMTAASRGEEVRFFFEEEYALLIGNRPRDLE